MQKEKPLQYLEIKVKGRIFFLLFSFFVSCVNRTSQTELESKRQRHPLLEVLRFDDTLPAKVTNMVPADKSAAREDLIVKVFFSEKLVSTQKQALNVFAIDSEGKEEKITSKGTTVIEGPFIAWVPEAKALESKKSYRVLVSEKIQMQQINPDGQHDSLDHDPNIDESLSFSFTILPETLTKSLKKNLTQEAQEKTKVYRVQGGPPGKGSKVRFENRDGTPHIVDTGHVYLDVGDERRALQFLLNRSEFATNKAQLPEIFTFEITNNCAEELRQIAVPQSLGAKYGNKPQIVDFNHGIDQFGLPDNLWNAFLECFVPGSIENISVFDKRWDKSEYEIFAPLLASIRSRTQN